MGSTHHHLSFISTAFSLGTPQRFDKGTRTPLKTLYHPPLAPLRLPTLHIDTAASSSTYKETEPEEE